ncbi:hypothetical protein Ait01nite_040450 [Actinoplanes italicus]|nr:hypothetical protein Ait01nite_040450 [Actinoplanes italicus]
MFSDAIDEAVAKTRPSSLSVPNPAPVATVCGEISPMTPKSTAMTPKTAIVQPASDRGKILIGRP